MTTTHLSNKNSRVIGIIRTLRDRSHVTINLCSAVSAVTACDQLESVKVDRSYFIFFSFVALVIKVFFIMPAMNACDRLESV